MTQKISPTSSQNTQTFPRLNQILWLFRFSMIFQKVATRHMEIEWSNLREIHSVEKGFAPISSQINQLDQIFQRLFLIAHYRVVKYQQSGLSVSETLKIFVSPSSSLSTGSIGFTKYVSLVHHVINYPTKVLQHGARTTYSEMEKDAVKVEWSNFREIYFAEGVFTFTSSLTNQLVRKFQKLGFWWNFIAMLCCSEIGSQVFLFPYFSKFCNLRFAPTPTESIDFKNYTPQLNSTMFHQYWVTITLYSGHL